MSIDRFTQNSTIQSIMKEVAEIKASEKKFSDIIDKDNNQYVDLVQEGGGVLGIALVGYTYVMEQAGIRFFSLAGTSAGAINTMLMGGLGKIDEPKSEKVLNILASQDLFNLVDGSKSVKTLISKFLAKEKVGWFLVWNGLKIYKTLKKKLGLNPGTFFLDWITDELKKVGISDLDELAELRKQLPDHLMTRDGKALPDAHATLTVITSDITTHSKTQFPEMAGLYWAKPGQVNPADLVRASMSIPFFFEPFRIDNLPNAGTENDPQWVEHASYFGPVPPSATFVDGGMLSNFPIDVFHSNTGVPRKPTFGARLSTYREEFSKNDSLGGMSGAMISTMRQIHDYEFLMQNPDFRKLICRIDADEQFNWLNFRMSPERQVELFNLGATKALEFLKGFDWEAYKKLRAGT